MYVCTYMYVSLYVCLYECMYVHLYEWTYVYVACIHFIVARMLAPRHHSPAALE